MRDAMKSKTGPVVMNGRAALRVLLFVLLTGLLLSGCGQTAGSDTPDDPVEEQERTDISAEMPERQAEAIAVIIGETSYSVPAFNYYYFSALNDIIQNAGSTASFLNLDPAKDLSEQDCPLSKDGGSWDDYLRSAVLDHLKDVTALGTAAANEGVSLSKGQEYEIDQQMEYLALQASDAGYEGLTACLEAQYGSGMSEELMRDILTKQRLCEVYKAHVQAQYDFSDDELAGYYRDHLYEYSAYSWLYAFAGNNDRPETAEICGELAAIHDKQTFTDRCIDLTGREVYTMTDVSGQELGDPEAPDAVWLSDPNRAEGDTFTGDTGSSSYVLYYLSRNDYGFEEDEDSSSSEWRVKAFKGLRDQTFDQWLETAVAGLEIAGGEGWESVGR